MIENRFEEFYNINYSDLDKNLALKPFALLNFLQDIATNNANQIGLGYINLRPQNLMWFLLKYRIEFLNYPFDTQKIKIITEPRGYNKLFVYRDFEIWNKANCLGRASSLWVLIDINTRKMVNPAIALPDNPRIVPISKREDDLEFQKIHSAETFDCKKEFIVRYDDIDINGHANNGNYIIWAFETLDIDFRISHKIKTMDIMYKKEALFNEKVYSELKYIDDLTTVHLIKNSNNEDLCLFECHWTKI